MAWGNTIAEIRLVLSGRAGVISGLSAVESQMGKAQVATARFGKSGEEATKRGFLLNQVLFTMRRYAYAGTIALTGLASAAIAMGVKFDASMESNQIAFEQFLGSAGAARKELLFLYHQAAVTPFEFSNITDAARRFLAFGFTLKETNDSLKVIGDTVAAFGGGGEQIERMVTVFGQIRASGRLLGQDLLQLEQQGIPVIDILTKKLAKYGVTRAMLSRPGELQIPSEIGIPALLEGMRERFAGAAARQAKTFTGQLSTAHDLISQIMGGLTLSSFNKASRGVLPAFNKMLTEMSQLAIKQKGKISLDQVLGIAQAHFPWLGGFIGLIKVLGLTLSILGNILKRTVLPALVAVSWVFQYGFAPWLLPILRFINKFTVLSYALLIIVVPLTFALIAEATVLSVIKSAQMAATASSFIFGMAQSFLRRMVLLTTDILTGQLWAYISLRIAMIRFTVTTKLAAAAEWLMSRATIAATVNFLRLRLAVVATWIALLGPVAWIIAGIVALIAILVVLYFKWDWFHKLVDRTWHFIKDHWMLLAAILIGPFGLFFKFVYDHFDQIVRWLQKIIDKVKDVLGWFKKIPGVSWLIGAAKGAWNVTKNAVQFASGNVGYFPAFPNAPMNSQGGVLQSPYHGSFAGPVQKSIATGQAYGTRLDSTVHTNIHIDGKKVAESVSKHRQNAQARK